MILEFKFSNFRSFYEEQSLSFVASPLKDREDCVTNVDSALAEKVLPLNIIYGSNASGKSNTIKALEFMAKQALNSYSYGDDGIDYQPFALMEKSSSIPSTFEISFVANDISYQYGFSCKKAEFTKEWLFAFPHGKKQTWFEREEQCFEFGDFLKGKKASLAELTPKNSLLLSVGSRSNHEQLEVIGNFFKSIDFNNYANVNEREISEYVRKNSLDKRSIEFLNVIGTGISGFKLQDETTSLLENKFLLSFIEHIGNFGELLDIDDSETDKLSSDDFKNHLKEEIGKYKQLFFLHEGALESNSGIAFANESEGTKRLVQLTEKAFKALDEGKLLVVDELDASLHTRACELFVSLFIDPSINTKGAQLLATTHDTNLLSCDNLRRDEVWFVEKDQRGQSALFSGAEFNMRKSQNLEKAYLDDRLGAIPPKVDPSWLTFSNG